MENSEIETKLIEARLEFLKEISRIQSQLYTPGIESRFQDEQEKRKFKLFRLQWSMYVQRVEIDILSVLVDKLEENESAFKSGIEAINGEVQNINNTVGFLNLLERGLKILERIIDLTI
ncbi:hypothetical protein [Crocosphaera sp. Alani8]|uniref:hypothetical protein n=1 Tax=Crocosphaera sp. Alani8 TaxID=3038952 RepID=UPI00313BC18F